MKTLILVGSPKRDLGESNSRILAETFVRNMKSPCEIRYIGKEDHEELKEYVKKFDTLLMIMPLYIHAMPGLVMKFIEKLEPADSDDKRMGFIVQAGFLESSQHRFLEPYLKDLTRQLNYHYLGTVSKGEAAGIYMYPKMFKKVLQQIADLGAAYEKFQGFDPDIVKALAQPVELSKKQLRLLHFVDRLGLTNIGWHSKLRKNGTLRQRLDKPYL